MKEIKCVTVRGYAKINLHLDITGRMAGGYHRVANVMQSVSLYDEITITPNHTEAFTVSCNIPEVPTDGRNLAVRAAELFCEAMGERFGADLKIDKQIPMAAGMAGGSTDAAAVLVGMNRLCGNRLSVEVLCELGSQLGADVPFCIAGGTAYADGKGDLLHPLPPMPACFLVLACEGERVSTPWAYGKLDTLYGGFEQGSDYCPRPIEPLTRALESGSLSALCDCLYNIFEEPILAERPVAAELRRLLLQNGAQGAMMSGSGPSVFGVFDTQASAERAARAIERCGYRPYICQPICPCADFE